VSEELFFRGFLGRGLVARFGAIGGILLTSLLFAVSHIDPVQVSYTFLLGILLHFVYLTTKSLVGPILLHTLYNAVGITRAKLVLAEQLTITTPSGEVIVPPLLLAAALPALLALCWLLYRSRSQWVLEDGTSWSPGYVTAEICPLPARAKRRSLGFLPSLLALVLVLPFGAAFAHAAVGWRTQGTVAALVQHAESCVLKSDYDQAIADCTQAIEIDPGVALAYVTRGDAYRLKGDYGRSFADCNKAIKLDPSNAQAFANRGETHRLKNEYRQALEDCNKAISLKRDMAWAFSIRGAIRRDQHDYRLAAANWEESLRLEPNHAWTRTRLAWLRAGCHDGELRSGAQAVKLADKACELTDWKEVDALSALAAAHAENGNFGEAIRWQQKALSLATGSDKESCAGLLELYRTGQPFRDAR
jgi:tetratricopeptide (TPR) repeat protein